MILVDEYIDEEFNTPMRYYFGIDFKKAMCHPKDGSEGMMFCFVESFSDSQKSFERELKIDNLLDGLDTDMINREIDNAYVFIYQTGEYQEQVYTAIKNKMRDRQKYPHPWVPVSRTGGRSKIVGGILMNGNKRTDIQ